MLTVLALFAILIGLAPTSDATQPRRRRRPPQNTEANANPADESATEKETESDDEEEEARYLVIEGGVLHPGSGAPLEGMTIVCRNGKIEKIGPNPSYPEDAEVIDASGRHVYPGLIAVRSSRILGGNPENDTDVFDLSMSLALAAGITTAVTGDTAAKLTFGTLDDMILKRNLFENIRYSSRDPDGKRKLRASLERVRQYLRDLDAWEDEKRDNPDAPEPDKEWLKGEYEKHLRLLKGEATGFTNARDQHDLLQICELAEDYGIRMVVDGAHEGWIVAPELARSGVSVIMSPRDRVDPNRDLLRDSGSTIENAARLHDHGVRLAIIPAGSYFGSGEGISLGGLAGRDLAHLSMEAAFAVRGGLSNDDAIKAITIDAARVLGIDHRVGSIEEGKDADFVIADGDLLHYMTLAQMTIVNGRVAYDKSKESIYSHIRPSNPDEPEPSDYWPRRLNADWVEPVDR